MGVTLNPFTGQLQLIASLSGNTIMTYANFAAFPVSATNGMLAEALDTHIIYVWNGSAWVPVAGPGSVLSVGTIDSQTASVDGAVISSDALVMQSASATKPGLVNNTTQSFSGNKTFTGTISASNLSGTNTGDITLTAVGSSPGANGASLSGQALTLQPADSTNPGLITAGSQTIGGAKIFASTISASNLSGTNTGDVTLGTASGLSLSSQVLSLQLATTSLTGALSSTDWNTFNSKQAAGNYITALTGDITASGPGSVAATVAKIQGTTVSGTTGSANVVFSSAPTLSNPIVGTQSQGDSSTKAASTSYVDVAIANAIAGVNPAVAVQAATTSAGNTSGYTYSNGVGGIGATLTGTNNTALTIDGYTFTAIGQRLLVKNDTQSPSGAYNGVYYVTQVQALLLPLILTRALDYDMPSDINNTGAIPVINGTVNGTTSWVLTSSVTTVGTDPLTFTEFTRNPADYLLKANNLSDVASQQTSLNNLAAAVTSGYYLRGSGTNVSMSAIQAGDVPTLNQNTTGTATNATNAANIATTAVSNSATYYPLFVASSSNGNQAADLGTGLTFNPSTNVLSTTTFSGALSGNATTATSATTATTATNATNTAITDDTTTNATMYPTWVTANTGNLPQKVSSTKLSFNPNTGTLTTTTVAAALTGTASGNTTISSQTNHGVVIASSTNAMTSTAAGSAGQVLTSNGASADPTFQAAPAPTFVGARYSNGAGSAYSSGDIINFNSAEVSSANVTTGASWKYTVPTGGAGKYLVNAFIELNSNSWTAGNFVVMRISVNGSIMAYGGYVALPTTATYYLPIITGPVVLNLADADYISAYLDHNFGGTLALYASSTYNQISIVKVGS